MQTNSFETIAMHEWKINAFHAHAATWEKTHTLPFFSIVLEAFLHVCLQRGSSALHRHWNNTQLLHLLVLIINKPLFLLRASAWVGSKFVQKFSLFLQIHFIVYCISSQILRFKILRWLFCHKETNAVPLWPGRKSHTELSQNTAARLPKTSFL